MQENDIDLSAQITPAQIKNYTEPTAKIKGIHISINTARTGKTEYNHGTIHVKCFDPLEECAKRGIFVDESHLWAARNIQTLFEVAFRNTNMRQYSLDTIRGNRIVFNLAPIDIYIRVMRGLLPWQAHLVRRLALSEVRPVDITGWIYHYRHRVQETFDALMILLENIYESAKDENITKPEVSLK